MKINYHNFTEKKKSYQSHKKNKHNIARYFWTWFLSIDANLSQITFSLITSTLIPPHYILSAGRLSPDQPGNEEIFEFFFTVLMSTASMRTMFYILSFLSLTTKNFGAVDSSRAHEPLQKLLLCFHHLNSCWRWVSPHILFVLSAYFDGYFVVSDLENIKWLLGVCIWNFIFECWWYHQHLCPSRANLFYSSGTPYERKALA